MSKLTKQYITEHEEATHSYQAFGKLLVDLILAEAKRQVGDEERDILKLNLNFEVSAYAPKDCIKIDVQSAEGIWWSIKQRIDEVELR